MCYRLITSTQKLLNAPIPSPLFRPVAEPKHTPLFLASQAYPALLFPLVVQCQVPSSQQHKAEYFSTRISRASSHVIGPPEALQAVNLSTSMLETAQSASLVRSSSLFSPV